MGAVVRTPTPLNSLLSLRDEFASQYVSKEELWTLKTLASEINGNCQPYFWKPEALTSYLVENLGAFMELLEGEKPNARD